MEYETESYFFVSLQKFECFRHGSKWSFHSEMRIVVCQWFGKKKSNEMYGYIRKKNQYCIFHAITEKDKISLNSKE